MSLLNNRLHSDWLAWISRLKHTVTHEFGMLQAALICKFGQLRVDESISKNKRGRIFILKYKATCVQGLWVYPRGLVLLADPGSLMIQSCLRRTHPAEFPQPLSSGVFLTSWSCFKNTGLDSLKQLCH